MVTYVHEDGPHRRAESAPVRLPPLGAARGGPPRHGPRHPHRGVRAARDRPEAEALVPAWEGTSRRLRLLAAGRRSSHRRSRGTPRRAEGPLLIAYADASILLRLALREPRSLPEWPQLDAVL